MPEVLVIHGPNMNLVDERDTELYGPYSLDALDQMLKQEAELHGIELECIQTNSEGKIIDLLHGALASGVKYIVLNAAAYTHTSVAIRDAVLGVDLPVVEVQVANVHAQEDFRRRSLLSDIVDGTISGFGRMSYMLALHWIAIARSIDGIMDDDKFVDEPGADRITH